MAEKAMKMIRNSIDFLFAFLYVLVLAVVLFVDKLVRYPQWAYNQSLLPNILLALGGAAVVAAGIGIWRKRMQGGRLLRKESGLGFYILLWGMSGLLLLLQVFISYHLYFIAGWDVSIVTGVADWIWLEAGSVGEHFYFSQYTNNVGIVYVLAVVSRIAERIGLKVTHYLVLVLVDCVMINLSGVLAALCVKRLTGIGKAGLLSFLLFIGLVGVNPWMVVPYTDTYSILFPVLTLYLYLCAKGTDRLAVECVLWGLLGLVGLFGYFIKPSAVLVLIAILCYEAVLLLTEKGRRRKAVLHFALIAAAFVLSRGMWGHMLDYTGSNLDEKLKFSYTHYLMLGLNEENVGAYNSDDYAFSSRQPDQETRKRENLRVAKERLEGYGPAGLLEFAVKKLLVNYNDGTFAWEKEGEFEQSPSYNRDTAMQRTIQRLFRSEAEWFGYYATFAQWIWVLVLLLVPAMGIRRGGRAGDGEYVVRIGMIGSFLFVMLFEARARYLYNMMPLFVICAAVGLRKLYGLGLSRAGRKA